MHALEHINLEIPNGQFVGIIGHTGSGKSTLVQHLNGLIRPTLGRVLYNGEDIWKEGYSLRELRSHVGLVFQYPEHQLFETDVITDVCFGPKNQGLSPEECRKRAEEALDHVGFPKEMYEKSPFELSGGQKRRVAIAGVLAMNPDFLVLDEPTNDLDVETLGSLENALEKFPGCAVVISHDRWFLDEVCTSMWEVHDGQVDPFEGGYSAYILQRVERDRMAAVTEERRRNMARKELAWLSRGAQARSTKPKFRVEAARELIADVPPVRDELELKRLAVSRLGKQVIDVIDVDAGYADTDGAPKQVLTDVTWLIGAGDRYGLLGENGAGKSTLLDVIQGKIEPTRGRVKIGQTVRFGVLSQQLEELEPYMGDTIREVLGNYKKYYVIDGKETSPEKLCERLGFTTQQLWSRIGDLSGGQRRRLSLLLTILDEPNVLILDEPGNDLDTDMLAIVEDLLDGWPGTLILVTHDRFLMERVTDQQWALLDGHLTHMPGGVDQYLRLCNATAEGEPVGAPSAKTGTFDTGAAAAAAEKPKSSGQPNGLSNAERQKLRREVSSLERKMETQRARVEEAEAAMAQVDPTNYTALGEQQTKIDEAHAAMDELEMAWLEASERLEGEE